jgi:catechol 2,3-dioxygenase-like lactoylglutathione lyase family enzyme
MSPTIRSVVVPVSDLDAAKAIYTALLGAPHTDQPYYVGYSADGFEVSLDPHGDVAGGPAAYADVDDPNAYEYSATDSNSEVDDLDAVRAGLLAAGATERSAPREVSPGARVCVLEDTDGNPVGLRGK